MARRPPSQRQYVPQPLPGFLDFQHPTLVAEPPTTARWIHEIKFDGYRMQVRVAGGLVTLYSRNGHDYTARLPELAAELSALPDCIMDAELCAVREDGMPDFGALQSAMASRRTQHLVLFVFDLLWHGQDDLRSFSLSDRKARLSKILSDAPARVRVVEAFETGGAALLASACRMSLEGIVSKRRDSRYLGGRSDAWVKSKCRPAQEFVVGGWLQEPQRAFKALLVGYYEGDRLRFAGSVKTGLGRGPSLVEQLHGLEVQSCPFAAGDCPRRGADVRWARPEVVVFVDFAEWTASGRLRQASLKGVRVDKDPREVRREVPSDVL